jgi:hypothetical protein
MYIDPKTVALTRRRACTPLLPVRWGPTWIDIHRRFISSSPCCSTPSWSRSFSISFPASSQFISSYEYSPIESYDGMFIFNSFCCLSLSLSLYIHVNIWVHLYSPLKNTTTAFLHRRRHVSVTLISTLWVLIFDYYLIFQYDAILLFRICYYREYSKYFSSADVPIISYNKLKTQWYLRVDPKQSFYTIFVVQSLVCPRQAGLGKSKQV